MTKTVVEGGHDCFFRKIILSKSKIGATINSKQSLEKIIQKFQNYGRNLIRSEIYTERIFLMKLISDEI